MFTLPSAPVLEAAATDADGTVAQVDFYATGIYIGSAYAPPFRFVWSSATPGTYQLVASATDDLGARTDSDPVSFTVRTWPLVTNPVVAYVVNSGTVGSQATSGGLGMDFDVRTNILVTRLGVFDSAGDGINGDATLTVQLYTRNGNSGTVLASQYLHRLRSRLTRWRQPLQIFARRASPLARFLFHRQLRP